MPSSLNDGSANAPKPRIYLNLDNLTDLRVGSLFPAGLARSCFASAKSHL